MNDQNTHQQTKTCKLKDGSIEVESLVVVTMLRLETLIKEDPIPFYELVMQSRNRDHRFFGNSGERLEELGFTNGGIVDSSIAAVARNAVIGEGFEMILRSPLATLTPKAGGR